ncbi:MAG: ABC transporter permease [Leadbetterella sp.]|nr:ABC transporter permease [Leadbetterella sp.]
MHKLWASVKKESLLLLRDAGALIILFVMPLALIITVTLIQQGSFKALSNAKIEVVLIDNDRGAVSKGVRENLEGSGSFEIIWENNGKPLTEEQAKDEVFKGRYPMAVIVPENLSADLNRKVQVNVDKILKDVGLGGEDTLTSAPEAEPREIRLYFDPATQPAFKSAVKNSIDKMVSELEVQSVYSLFQEQLSDSVAIFSQQSFLHFKEIMPFDGKREVIPNATQHNVPAWTLFAIFFIVIPLSINLVKEKGQGTLVRLRTLPMPYSVVIMGKTLTFLVICMIQFYLMVAVGVYLFPLLGLEPLQIGGKLFLMSVVALCSGFAAIGFGILLGTVSQTQEQSAPFGATSVVILAAIGGVWVPVFAMPAFMQFVSGFSPMNWGLNAFYDVILRTRI